MAPALPSFVEPMLAAIGKPFDSERHLFEIKWDGTRALAFVESGDYRLLNRRKRNSKPRYPELAFLAGLEAGLLLDGEIVMLKDGKPDFESMLRREQASGTVKINALMRSTPAIYVAFDVLYRQGESLMDQPLSERRKHLEEVTVSCDDPRLVLSDGVVGDGMQFFEAIKERELEGMVAKELDSRYLPAKRTDSWLKIKQRQQIHCLILGVQYDESGREVRSLIIATDFDGELRCVGKVGSGLNERVRAEIDRYVEESSRDEPLIECELDGEWVEPGLYCTVNFLERSSSGNLRAPVFVGLVKD